MIPSNSAPYLFIHYSLLLFIIIHYLFELLKSATDVCGNASDLINFRYIFLLTAPFANLPTHKR